MKLHLPLKIIVVNRRAALDPMAILSVDRIDLIICDALSHCCSLLCICKMFMQEYTYSTHIPAWQDFAGVMIHYVSEHDGTVLRETVGYQSGSTFLTNLRSNQCSEIWTPLNLKTVLTNTTKYQVLAKPLGLLYVMWSKVPNVYYDFWKEYFIEKCLINY